MTNIAVPSPTTAKLGRVATIGYHQPQAWQIVTHMVYEQGWQLVDIRYNRRSYLEEWSGSSLRRHFRSSYHAVPELGDVNHLAPENPIQLADALVLRYGGPLATLWLAQAAPPYPTGAPPGARASCYPAMASAR